MRALAPLLTLFLAPWLPLLRRRVAGLAVPMLTLCPLASLAQNPSPVQNPVATTDAAQPAAPTAPLVHPHLAPTKVAAGVAPSAMAWREANEAVADFPRGHADILAWEAQQGTAPASPATAKPGPMHHQGAHAMHPHRHTEPGGKP